VTAGVISRFVPFVQEDLDHEELTRAAKELSALERMLNRLTLAHRLGARSTICHAHDTSAAPGPRLKVQDGVIVVANQAEDAAEHGQPQPIFLTGYSEFQQVRDDVGLLPTVGEPHPN
jgi:hypothetical protein